MSSHGFIAWSVSRLWQLEAIENFMQQEGSLGPDQPGIGVARGAEIYLVHRMAEGAVTFGCVFPIEGSFDDLPQLRLKSEQGIARARAVAGRSGSSRPSIS